MVVLSSINLRMMTVGIDQQDLSDTLYLLISGQFQAAVAALRAR